VLVRIPLYANLLIDAGLCSVLVVVNARAANLIILKQKALALIGWRASVTDESADFGTSWRGSVLSGTVLVAVARALMYTVRKCSLCAAGG
jgi:hypothetical protein